MLRSALRWSVRLRADRFCGGQHTCSKKGCHRTLPADAAGAICARCKERLKKRVIKAKQRFKLEPKKLLARPPHASDAAAHADDGEDGDAETAEQMLLVEG